ncbi:tRNA (adenosine(37)-N6)-threonylcarbamoyltransferase complex transferase subunit TsaD [Candidatus Woesebacteria bacterium]|nr:tRNA (adenosine(37)-N6)-threonylcarbamoyltransferase complex transferase subunit TsaD [Candidatus Woesebacteria bacterium]
MILSIDTSADDTSVAVTQGRRVISHVEFSQISLHQKWGGIFPTVAKRAHKERIDGVVEIALKKAKTYAGSYNDIIKHIDAIAVTQGPGLAPALEVGIRKAVSLAKHFHKPLIAVNHMEGHIYSCFAQNRAGNPERVIRFPYLALLVSGGHTELVILRDHLSYEVIGATKDDAVGEALDKAARMLGFGYPGGPIFERLAAEVGNVDVFNFPRPMMYTKDLDFSYSGLKTSFLYFLRKLPEEEHIANLQKLASSFQEAAFAPLVKKTEDAMKQYNITSILVGGGVAVNKRLRNLMRAMVRKHKGAVYFPPARYLNNDNAAMIGIVADYKCEKKLVIDPTAIDRRPRWSLRDL